MTSSSLDIRSWDAPDVVRDAPNEQVAEVVVGATTITRVTAGPGWRWSDVFQRDSCGVEHTVIYMVSGRLGLRMDDGTQGVAGPGEFFFCPAGHDSWVVGDEPAVFMDIKPAGVVMPPKPGQE